MSLSGLADEALPCQPEKFLQIVTPTRLPTVSFAATLGLVILTEPLQRRFDVLLARRLGVQQSAQLLDIRAIAINASSVRGISSSSKECVGPGLGLLAAIPSFVGLVFAFPAGAIADRIGCQRVLLLGTSLSTLSLAGIILLTEEVWLSALSVASGCAQTPAMVSGAPFLTENSTPQERTSLFSASFGLSTLVGFLGKLGLVWNQWSQRFEALATAEPARGRCPDCGQAVPGVWG